MPLPIALLGASIVRASDARPDEVGLRAELEDHSVLAKRCARSLAALTEQRDAVTHRTIPRVHAAWKRVDAEEEARSVFDDRASLLLADHGDALPSHAETESIDTLASNDLLTDRALLLGEMIRLDAVASAACRGVEALAHLRLRIYAHCRRLEELSEVRESPDAWTAHERRMLAASARLAGSAAAFVRIPAVSPDGGIDRRFSAALRQL